MGASQNRFSFPYFPFPFFFLLALLSFNTPPPKKKKRIKLFYRILNDISFLFFCHLTEQCELETVSRTAASLWSLYIPALISVYIHFSLAFFRFLAYCIRLIWHASTFPSPFILSREAIFNLYDNQTW